MNKILGKVVSHPTCSLFPVPCSLNERKAARGFTLIEVNLAMMIMAVGALSIVGLYAFGYRESTQSREDVEATALADQVISPLVMAVSHTNQKWSVFRRGFHFPDKSGWGAYFDGNGGVTDDPDGKAEGAFSDTLAQLGAGGLRPSVNASFPSKGSARTMSCGLVVQHEEGSPVVRISFRATPRPGSLLAMPIFYTEARFQGDPNL